MAIMVPAGVVVGDVMTIILPAGVVGFNAKRKLLPAGGGDRQCKI